MDISVGRGPRAVGNAAGAGSDTVFHRSWWPARVRPSQSALPIAIATCPFGRAPRAPFAGLQIHISVGRVGFHNAFQITARPRMLPFVVSIFNSRRAAVFTGESYLRARAMPEISGFRIHSAAMATARCRVSRIYRANRPRHPNTPRPR